ncbi:MAG: ATP-binding protein [Rhodothermales bacterium]|nr:ATP-binding protein [Rhodothermales bacterium]
MHISPLAWRVAWPTGLVTALALLAVRSLGAGESLLGLMLAATAAATTAYVAARQVAVRIKALHETVAPREATAFRGQADELDALARAVQKAEQGMATEIAELRRLEHYRREFLGNVSHELKTPVFAIQGFAETLLDGALDDERVRRPFTEKILRNTTRLHALTRDLTDIARIETGELTMAKASFRLDRLASEMLDAVQPLADARSVTLALDAPEALPPVLGDRDRIGQVVTNLLANAVAYNREGGQATVRLAVEGDAVRCTVEDTGIGIAPQHLPRLTERFYRVDRSRSREQGGTGLGLAIVKHLLAAHDATLAVESTPGVGSRFGFALPIVDAPRPRRER